MFEFLRSVTFRHKTQIENLLIHLSGFNYQINNSKDKNILKIIMS